MLVAGELNFSLVWEDFTAFRVFCVFPSRDEAAGGVDADEAAGGALSVLQLLGDPVQACGDDEFQDGSEISDA